MADFDAIIKKLKVKFNIRTADLMRGTVNDEHTILYGWNSADNAIVAVWVDKTTKTIQSKEYKNTNRQCIPTTYGDLIYYNNTLVRFGGCSTTNAFFEFDFAQSQWSQVLFTGNEMPNRYSSLDKTIRYKHYAIIVGHNEQNDDAYGLWILDLKKRQAEKIFSSKIMNDDNIGGYAYGSHLQLLNDDILILKPYWHEYIYYIDLSILISIFNMNKDKQDKESKKNQLSQMDIDWNKVRIENSSRCSIGSNNDCFILFKDDDKIVGKENSIFLFTNDNENENYQIKLNNNDCNQLNTGYKKIVRIKNLQLLLSSSCFWLNDTFVWVGKSAIYYLDVLFKANTSSNDNCHYKCNSRFKIVNKVGTGATSIVYNAILNIGSDPIWFTSFRKKFNLTRRQSIVIKQENSISNETSTLLNEYNMLKKIHFNKDTSTITCQLYDHFIENGIHHIAISKLGLSLQHLYLNNNNNFSLFQSLLMLNEMLIILYKLHSLGIVHNDIKPENILIDNPNNLNNNKYLKLYLIDFGISKIFWDFDNNWHCDKIIQKWDSKTDEFIPFEGTYRFSSFDHHCYMIENKSRKQDIESLLYMIIYFIKNDLPWMISDNKNIKTQKNLYLQTQKIKRNASIDNDICKNIPKQFGTALKYVRNLKFEQCPDYKYLYNLFDQLLKTTKNGICDGTTDMYKKEQQRLDLESLSYNLDKAFNSIIKS